MRLIQLTSLALAFGLVVGCGSSSDGTEGSGGTSNAGSGNGGSGNGGTAQGGNGGTGGGNGGTSNGGTAGVGGNPFQGETFQVGIGPIQVASGDENTQCIVTRLGNPNPIHVGAIRNVISSSSHHMIVYRTADTEERLTPFDCTPFVETLDPSKGAPLMVTQKKDDELRLPDGVAFTLEANQMIRIELHYINTTPNPVEVTATSAFHTMDDSLFQNEADFLFIGSPDINVPAHGTQKLGPMFFKMPSQFADSNFFAITGHTHQYGVNMTVDSVASASDPGTAVYDVPNWAWDEPETVSYDPPFQVPQGGGFNFTCEWDNTSNSNVGFGESANQEMCFFWSYYYPSKGAKVCFVSEQYNVTECCPGGALCSLISQYLGL
ncbi:MAG: hypothetical protein R3B07_01475 [Polyangiaceae bacterium]